MIQESLAAALPNAISTADCYIPCQGRNLVSSTLNVNLVNDDIKVTLGANIEEKITARPKKMAGRRGFRLMEGSVDSFHPSTPGHSPGIGHSKHD
ncbi:hypothetical protein K7X08_017460 [Anisodus acutangulus]|uniref:Uncharacterized protein n=1 Tax=Anisodus acutangulus TaxID=402998 RepID=A0A9Q1R8J8_9SOLA|nr:hypothetical protein K7X08_017460 [Anisodus acutangulus]